MLVSAVKKEKKRAAAGASWRPDRTRKEQGRAEEDLAGISCTFDHPTLGRARGAEYGFI